MVVKNSPMASKKTNDNLKKLRKTVENKKFILHFLPSFFDNIIENKTIPYKGKKLKVDYLVNIVSDFITKYNFKKTNGFSTSATILKERYGVNYCLYIDYLKENNVINLDRNYLAHNYCRTYSLKPHILNQKLKRYKNRDKIILKKYKKRILSKTLGSINNPIEHEIKQKLLVDLSSIDIDYKKSLEMLGSLKDNDFISYNKNIHVIESIRDNDIFYAFDEYGRMHTNFTILRSDIRKNCLTIDGKKVKEIDISNSQPLFLAKLLNDCNSKWVNENEFNDFKMLTKSGTFYQYFMDNLGIKNKSDIKDMTYKVLFGQNKLYKSKKSDKLFRTKKNENFEKLFPSIFKFITLYKKEHNNYKVLAYKLQKMESEVIYNKIIKEVMEINSDIKMFTIHDSIVVSEDYYDVVNSIFQKTLLSEFDF